MQNVFFSVPQPAVDCKEKRWFYLCFRVTIKAKINEREETEMLKLVLGASGSGKTTLLYARIRARAEAGKRSILLVPEQFTSSTEARIYRELGDALSGMVESYSFTSLAEHILAALGSAAPDHS